MSSPDGIRRHRRWLGIVAAAALPLLGACSVQPLYSTQTASLTGSVRSDLASVAIDPVEERYAQEVRNHLIFLFTGGAARPAAPLYTLTLSVASLTESAAVVQVAEENEPTAGTVTLIANYVIKDATGERVARGKRQISSAYDVPRQEFAALRAQRDAEDRAARELAELLRLAVAHDLQPRG